MRRIFSDMRVVYLLLAACFIATSASAEKRAAFLVGNAQYDQAPALRNPGADVDLIADTLEALDFNVAKHNDLSRAEIAGELSRFLDDNQNADVTLFYFAGHGMQFENRNYLLGTDANLKTMFDVEAYGLDLNRVIELLSQKSKAALVFVDACRDNPLATRFYSENYSETRATMTRGLARVGQAFNGTMLTFSASPGQVAFDGDGAHSPFAASLARHLPSENMEVLSLMKRVTRDVRSATSNQQTPMVTNDLVQEIFLKRGEGTEAAAIAYRQEEQLFEAATAINTLRVWDVFLDRYPDGSFYQQALDARDKAEAFEIASLSGTSDAQRRVSEAMSTGDRIELSSDGYREAEGGLVLDRNKVRQIQAELNRRGYDAGPEDGVLGNGTRRAVADFQAFVGLPSTGAVTEGTAQRLGVELEKAEADGAAFVASRNARRYDPLQLALFEDDKRLLRAAEALRGLEFLYGYYGDHLYIAVLTWKLSSFEDAQRLAEGVGGYLATIGSEGENNFVYNMVRHDLRMWRQHSDGRSTAFGPSFGLHQIEGSREPNGGWVWVTGEPVTYSNWLPGSPINAGGNANVAAFIWDRWPERVPGPIRTAPTWHDMDYAERALVIEIE